MWKQDVSMAGQLEPETNMDTAKSPAPVSRWRSRPRRPRPYHAVSLSLMTLCRHGMNIIYHPYLAKPYGNLRSKEIELERRDTFITKYLQKLHYRAKEISVESSTISEVEV